MRHAVIVAGGKGLRMQTDLPKQFLPLHGVPVLMRTLQKFHAADTSMNITLVLPEAHQSLWSSLCQEHDFSIPHQCVNGGETRFESVQNGLRSIPNASVVAIHDGVRPMLSTQLILRCFEEAERHGSALPVVSVSQSLRRISNQQSEVVDRTGIAVVQTPQVFTYKAIADAYEQTYSETFTDDATVFEAAGGHLHLVDGEEMNLKITRPEDLRIAEALWFLSTPS